MRTGYHQLPFRHLHAIEGAECQGPRGNQLADPATVSIVIPAKDEAPVIAGVVRLRDAAPWREIIVVDDGSSDANRRRAREAAW